MRVILGTIITIQWLVLSILWCGLLHNYGMACGSLILAMYCVHLVGIAIELEKRR